MKTYKLAALPMPFRKHIAIELENPSAENLTAYTDVQWEQVDRIPDDCGYLRTDYRSGKFQASKPLVLCQINRPATIVAHWRGCSQLWREIGVRCSIS